MWLTVLIVYFSVYLFFGYIFGSIPFGYIFAKIFGYGDIRTIGSGNIGATNALRTGNKTLAFLTLLFDSAKGGAVIVLFFHLQYFDIMQLLNGSTHRDIFPGPAYGNHSSDFTKALILGFGAILGHCFPIWLKFKGGKGVATTFGVLLTAVPLAGLAAAVTWGIVAGVFRISSLAALCAAAIAPLATWFLYGTAPAIVTLLITLLVFWRHKENIQRLLKGEESKIGQKKERTREETELKEKIF